MARIQVRRHRRQSPGKHRLRQAHWIDPYPSIPGTEPEKRVFEQLVKMHVFFIFQGQIPEFSKGGKYWYLAPPAYKPDFVLPEYKLIIDPFSPFHHSLPDAARRDVEKIADYNIVGYAYYHPWAIDAGQWQWSQYEEKVSDDPHNWRKTRTLDPIRGRMSTLEMLRMIPELNSAPLHKLIDPRDIKAKAYPGYRIGEFLGAGANSVAAANATRKRGPKLTLRSSR